MPPKKAAAGGGGGNKKTEQKVKQKIVDDKTFGLKNKNKSKSVQKYVNSVQKQVGVQSAKTEKALAEKRLREKEEEERKKLEKELFKVAVKETKVPLGVDPKSVVCEYYKQGICTKGNKCKFSHDVDVGRKGEKIDIYTDVRGVEEDSMEKWDQKKLEEVVDTKQTQENRNLKTTIVCKFFLQALEERKYGWFWECPNGGEKCMYRHALPPGYQLKVKKKPDEEEEEEEGPSLEEQIEEERAKLPTRTALTLETFMKWKEEKKKRKEQEVIDNKKKKEESGKISRAMRSGREMFEFNPELFVDDENVFDTGEFPSNEDDGPVHVLEATGTSLTRKTIIREKQEGAEEGAEEGEEGEEGEEEYEVEDYDEGQGNEKETNEGEEENEDGKEEEGEEEIQEELFKEEEIPEEEDE